uniref:Uncharacterized protein n=1 Tax=Schistosoma haematobium TaxID=6185 RepID=A0A095BZ13_SCHHA
MNNNNDDNNNNKESNYALKNNNFNQKINNSIKLKQNQFIENSFNHKQCSIIFRIKELNDKLNHSKGKFIINKNINNEILLRNIISNEIIKNQLFNKNFTQLIIDLNNNNNMKDLSLLKMFNNQSFIHLLLSINKDTILNNLIIKNIINNLNDKENRSIDHLDDYYIQKIINLTEMNTDHSITKVSNMKINKEEEYDNEIDQLIGEEQSFNEVLGNNKLGTNLIKKQINIENKNKLLTNNNRISISKKYRRKRSANNIDLGAFNAYSSSTKNINRNNKQKNNQKKIKINNKYKINRRIKKDINTDEENHDKMKNIIKEYNKDDDYEKDTPSKDETNENEKEKLEDKRITENEKKTDETIGSTVSRGKDFHFDRSAVGGIIKSLSNEVLENNDKVSPHVFSTDIPRNRNINIHISGPYIHEHNRLEFKYGLTIGFILLCILVIMLVLSSILVLIWIRHRRNKYSGSITLSHIEENDNNVQNTSLGKNRFQSRNSTHDSFTAVEGIVNESKSNRSTNSMKTPAIQKRLELRRKQHIKAKILAHEALLSTDDCSSCDCGFTFKSPNSERLCLTSNLDNDVILTGAWRRQSNDSGDRKNQTNQNILNSVEHTHDKEDEFPDTPSINTNNFVKNNETTSHYQEISMNKPSISSKAWKYIDEN